MHLSTGNLEAGKQVDGPVVLNLNLRRNIYYCVFVRRILRFDLTDSDGEFDPNRTAKRQYACILKRNPEEAV